MEDETREFLVKILNSVTYVLIWMIANVFFGIYKGYAFFENTPLRANYLYYALMLISFVYLVFLLKKKWKF